MTISFMLIQLPPAAKKLGIRFTTEQGENWRRNRGFIVRDHRARQITKEDYEVYDYLIGMDEANIRNMHRMLGADPDKKIYKLLDFTARKRNIADPWYTGNFDETYKDVVDGCEGLLRFLQEKYGDFSLNKF